MRHDIRQFEKLLKQNSRSVMGDPFIRAYIEDLLKNIRTQVLLKVITPYTRISVTARQRRPQTPPQGHPHARPSWAVPRGCQQHARRAHPAWLLALLPHWLPGVLCRLWLRPMRTL